MNIFLLVAIFVIYAFFFVCSAYALICFSHDDDINEEYFPKIVVVIGLTLSLVAVFLVPLDVANRSLQSDSLPMETIWLCIYGTICLLLFIVIPFSYFYYLGWTPENPRELKQERIDSHHCVNLETHIHGTNLSWSVFGPLPTPILTLSNCFTISNNTKSSALLCYATFRSAFVSALVSALVFFSLFVLLTLLLYYLSPKIPIPIFEQHASLTTIIDVNAKNCAGCKWSSAESNMQVSMSLVIASFAIIAALAGFFFFIFAGFGLIVTPYDFFQKWYMRPQPMNKAEFQFLKVQIGKIAGDLIALGVSYREKPPSRKAYNEWVNQVDSLEDKWDKCVEAQKPNGIRVIWYWFNLFMALVGTILTVTWIVHLLVFNVLDVHPFLNNLLVKLDGLLSLFGIIILAIYSFWLQICLIKGKMAISLGLPFLFSIHPLKPSGTLMHSLLFNTGLLALSSVTLTQLCSLSFRQYARMTSVYLMFEVAIKNIEPLKWIWILYTYGLFAMAGLSTIYITMKECCCKKRSKAKVSSD